MCGRFVAATDPDGLVRFFVVDDRHDEDVAPSYNVAPTDPVRAVVLHAERRRLVTFRWGLVPHWADDPRVGSRMINARSETAADRPAFREALGRRRCLVPADGFYEWQRNADGGRVPYFIRPVDEPMFAFAGLWAAWRNRRAPEAPPLRTCAILTMPADERLAPLHARMPVVLPRTAWDVWLDGGTSDPEILRGLLAAGAPGAIAVHPVSPDVNTPRNNRPDLVLPIG